MFSSRPVVLSSPSSVSRCPSAIACMWETKQQTNLQQVVWPTYCSCCCYGDVPPLVPVSSLSLAPPCGREKNFKKQTGSVAPLPCSSSSLQLLLWSCSGETRESKQGSMRTYKVVQVSLLLLESLSQSGRSPAWVPLPPESGLQLGSPPPPHKKRKRDGWGTRGHNINLTAEWLRLLCRTPSPPHPRTSKSLSRSPVVTVVNSSETRLPLLSRCSCFSPPDHRRCRRHLYMVSASFSCFL